LFVNLCSGKCVLGVVVGVPGGVGLGAGHVGHSVAPHCDVVALDLLADFDHAVVEELQCAGRLESEQAREPHGLFHAHLNGVDHHQPDHLLRAGGLGQRPDLEGLVPVVGVLPEADFVFLQEGGVVEVLVASHFGEVHGLAGVLEVLDPSVRVADFKQQ